MTGPEFEALATRLRPEMVRYARSVGLGADAEDAVQRVLANVWKRHEAVRGETGERYVWRAMRYGVLSWRRRVERDPVHTRRRTPKPADGVTLSGGSVKAEAREEFAGLTSQEQALVGALVEGATFHELRRTHGDTAALRRLRARGRRH